MTIAKKKSSKQVKKRPLGVWLISAFYFMTSTWGLLSLYIVKEFLNEPGKSPFERLTVLDYVLSFGIAGFGIAGAISLFGLKKSAIKLFTLSFALNVVATILQLLKTNFGDTLEIAGAVGGMFVGLGLVLAIILYCKRIDRQGYLS